MNSTTFNFNDKQITIEFSDFFDTSIIYEPLKIHFLIISNTVVMRVLNQDDRIRFHQDGNFKFEPLFVTKIQDENNKKNNLLKFYSLHNVELNKDALFLRGTDITADNKTASHSFNSTVDSLRFVALVTEILKNIPCLNAEVTSEIISIPQKGENL